MIATASDTAVSALRAAVDGLLAVDWPALAPVEVAGLISELEVQRRRLGAVDVRAVASLAGQASPAAFGATSVPDLVGALTRTTRGAARARVQRAQDLAPRRTLAGEPLAPIHPLTAAALSVGEISPEHVDVITRYLGRLPSSTSFETFAAAEAFLVQAARHEDPALLRRSGELLLARLDPDGQEPREQEQERQRCFGIGDRRGANTVHGQLTDELKAVVQTMLDALAAPRPGVDGEPDPRSAGQRNHDALLEALLRLLGSDTLPAAGGTPAKVVIHVDAEDLDRFVKGRPGGVARTGHGDVVSIERFLRLADQADITTVVLTAHGEILDHGRNLRCATAAQRRTLAARDGGCCFPGCTRPAAWTEAHHIRAWIRGGRTDLNNLCLLCAFHHRSFESAGWAVVMLDGVPQWIPPAWLDPSRRPRRNTAHHLPKITFGRWWAVGTMKARASRCEIDHQLAWMTVVVATSAIPSVRARETT